MVTPGNMRRKNSAISNHQLNASKFVAVVPAAHSVSGQMDAMQLRDELLHLKKEMNAIKKEKDIAKAQQVVWGVLIHGSIVHTECEMLVYAFTGSLLLPKDSWCFELWRVGMCMFICMLYILFVLCVYCYTRGCGAYDQDNSLLLYTHILIPKSYNSESRVQA